jgi:hypothetical protein
MITIESKKTGLCDLKSGVQIYHHALCPKYIHTLALTVDPMIIINSQFETPPKIYVEAVSCAYKIRSR